MDDGSTISELTQEEALRVAYALVGQALKETEARCGVLGQFINSGERKGPANSARTEVFSELSALHRYRGELVRRRDLIQQALDSPVGECPAEVPLPAPASRIVQTQQQIQIQVRRQRRS